MFNQNIEVNKILKSKKFQIKITNILDDLAKEFIFEFSDELKQKRKIFKSLEIDFLQKWTSKKNLSLYLKNYQTEQEFRAGRGLIFHICPNNVPTNFIFSFFLGLLSGNSNIVKLPSSNSKEKKLLLEILNHLFKKKKYERIKRSNLLFEIPSNDKDFIKNLSKICNGRVIWGGDKTIEAIKNFKIPNRSIDVSFSDRYSFSLINSSKFSNLTKKNIEILSRKFFFDGYLMNQMACNSPHVIIWIGKKNNQSNRNNFWKNLYLYAKKNFHFDSKMNIDKIEKLYQIINDHHKDISKLKKFENYIYLLQLKKRIQNIENLRGYAGIFFELEVDDIAQLKELITIKCQTLSQFGFEINELKKLILDNNILGIDRIVPFGKALEFDFNWDGYDVVRSLSRTINIKK